MLRHLKPTRSRAVISRSHSRLKTSRPNTSLSGHQKVSVALNVVEALKSGKQICRCKQKFWSFSAGY